MMILLFLPWFCLHSWEPSLWDTVEFCWGVSKLIKSSLLLGECLGAEAPALQHQLCYLVSGRLFWVCCPSATPRSCSLIHIPSPSEAPSFSPEKIALLFLLQWGKAAPERMYSAREGRGSHYLLLATAGKDQGGQRRRSQDREKGKEGQWLCWSTQPRGGDEDTVGMQQPGGWQ